MNWPRYIVDAHTLILFLAGNPALGSAAKAALLDPGSTLFLPAIALAETLLIVESRRMTLTPAMVLDALDSERRLNVHPLTREIVEIAHGLKAISEMHDRQIVATAIDLADESGAPILLTKDAEIAASELVPVAW